MSQAYVYEEGGKACAEEGQVMLDGPDGVAMENECEGCLIRALFG